MNSRTPTVAGLALLLLAACAAPSNDDQGTSSLPILAPTPTTATVAAVQISPACSTAMDDMIEAYAGLPDTASDDALNAVELPPLSACSSAAEWVAAAQANPSALGLTGPQFIDPELELRVRCSDYLPGHRATTVCQDAIAAGLVE